MERDDRVDVSVFLSLRNDSVLIIKWWMEWFLSSILVLYMCMANSEFKTKTIDVICIVVAYQVFLAAL